MGENMISKLTKQQEKAVPKYLKKWLDVGYRTKTTDKKKAKAAVNFLYKDILKMEKPKYVIFLDSPMACQLACNLIKDSKFDQKIKYSQLRSQLRSQLDSQLRSQLYSQLYSQLRSQNLERFYETRSNWWNNYYWHYDYILNELFPEKKKEFKLFLEYNNHSTEFHQIYMFEGICFVSDFPKAIRKNETNHLHSFDSAALEYRDGYSLYYSNGVQMKKEYIETPKDRITKEMFLSEKNVDVRRELSHKMGIDKTIEMLGAEVVDTYISKVGNKYELLMIDFNNNGTKRPYLKMINPSMKDVNHIEGVHPDCKTVQDAIMFRNGLTKFVEPESLS